MNDLIETMPPESGLQTSLETGVVLTRKRPKGSAETNVPHTFVHHSPSGFEWGYEGSGPAELALNVLAYYVTAMGLTEDYPWTFEIRNRAKCSVLAWNLHQHFKSEVIAHVPEAGGFIPAKRIRSWIRSHNELALAGDAA